MKYADFGSISHATMRNEDLIPCFRDELETLLSRQSRRFKRKEYRATIREADKIIKSEDWDSEAADYALDALFGALEAFAPPYTYFGAHEGDGSDYGFWLGDFPDHNFDGLKVSSLSDIPKGYRGEVLEINDHGNMTLGYVNSRGDFKTIWAVV
jgi:hypothetical protein